MAEDGGAAADVPGEDGALSLDDLRQRVRAAEERFERVGEDSRASRRRLVALIRALGDERQRRMAEIEALTQRVNALDDENAELRVLLAELLDAAEAIDDEEGLSALESELAAAQAAAGEVVAETAPAPAPEAVADVAEEDLGDDELGDDELADLELADAEPGGDEQAAAPTAPDEEVLELTPAADTDEEAPLELGGDSAPAAGEEAPAAEPAADEKAEEKSDAETDQLDRILKSIRRITS